MSLTSRLPRDVLFTSSKSCDKLTVWSNTEIAAKAMCDKKQAYCCYTMEIPCVIIVCTPSILEYPFLNYSGARNNFSRYRPTLLQFERGMRSSPCYSTFFRFSRLPPLSHKPLLKPGGSNRIFICCELSETKSPSPPTPGVHKQFRPFYVIDPCVVHVVAWTQAEESGLFSLYHLRWSEFRGSMLFTVPLTEKI